MNINDKYKILPYLVDLRVPGFFKHYEQGSKTLSVSNEDAKEQYEFFCQRILNARGEKYLPVMRMSDGEYQFFLGEQPPSSRNLSLVRYIGKFTKYLKRKYFNKGGFSAATLPGVSSGEFNKQERQIALRKYGSLVKEVSEKGVLALHLTFNPKPFQEKYHPALKQWLKEYRIELTKTNYAPFYFVYALFRGEYKNKIFKNQRVMVIHGAEGDKQSQIKRSIIEMGAMEVHWCKISGSKSFFDTIDVSEFKNKVDIVVIGAGIGKPNIITQLDVLSVPCIDVGYVFEIWADEAKKWLRTYTVPDDEWDEQKIKFR